MKKSNGTQNLIAAALVGALAFTTTGARAADPLPSSNGGKATLLNRFNFKSDSDLKSEADGSLTILLASNPNAAVPESNWLPAPAGKACSLTLRTDVPKDAVKRGEWFPPALRKLK